MPSSCRRGTSRLRACCRGRSSRSTQRFRHERDDASGVARRHWVSLAPALGYQWLPFGTGPYLTPWAALGLPVVKSGDTALGPHGYQEPKLAPILAVHIGWELGI